MTDQQQLPLLPPHRNRGLFADHYLDRVLPNRPEWHALAAEAEPVRERIIKIFAGFVPGEDEAQNEKDLIRPILDILGFEYEVNVRLRVPGTHPDKPDYAFYRDNTARQANKSVILDKRFPDQGGIAIGDAKRWNRPLDHLLRDGRAGGNENPSYQIHKYVLYSGVEWGILTNGKLWRLVHRETADRLDVYYEVDLEEVVRSGGTEDFLYFFAFFRRAAFDSGPLGLVELLNASITYARNVGAGLKVQVYDALRHLAQGFLDYRDNHLIAESETLAEIYNNALILLYRLIFILYAEARELLPIRENAPYREIYSLQAIKQAVASDLSAGRRFLPTSARIWPQLKELFGYINRGEPPLYISTFNGGLFDPSIHPFLEKYTVGDHHLQQAIDMLSRVNGEFVDYRDLAVRHMGTIYEGLLEYHLVPTPGIEPAFPPNVDLPPVLADKQTSHPKDNQKTKIQDSKFTIDLVNDKGERKATGSYYTPDYVVKFMIERAVGPALRKAVEGKETDAAKVQAVLEVNVLDPAMGSGHFLVEAVEYIARFLVDLGVATTGKTPEEADLAFWKRRVVQSCVYGVDLNPLAVELAKLSLWLITVAKDRPLSFLDHHLRPGNSLVGARLDQLQSRKKHDGPGRRKSDLAKENGQISLFDDSAFTQRVKLAVDNMWLIEGSEAYNVGDVKNQELMYENLRRHFTAKYACLLHLVTAVGFGLTIEPSHWPALIKYVTNGNGATFPAFDTLLKQADDIAARERFFHWELEFPEVYFDRHGRSLDEDGGFEVVIGNPPYVRSGGLAPYKSIFAAAYPEVYHGMADLFVYFFAQGLRQVRRNGRHSYISSNSWLRTNYATPLRHFLRTTATVEMLVDLDDNHVFTEAPDVYPAIHLVRKALPAKNHTARAAVFSRGEGVQPFETKVDEKLFSLDIHDQPDSGWQLSLGESRRLFAKLMTAGRPLAEIVNGKMYRGVLTGLNEAFIIDQATKERIEFSDPNSNFFLHKLVNGEDVRKWYIEENNRWLILIPNGWTKKNIGGISNESDAWSSFTSLFPAVAAHLAPFAEPAGKRQDMGEFWWELRPCSYYAEFNHSNIFWPEMAKMPRFAIADPGIVCNKTAFLLSGVDPFILGVLNSRTSWFTISNLCVSIGERAGMLRYTLSIQFISRLPIPAALPADREAISSLAMNITRCARERYALHRRVRHRLLSDLGTPDAVLNNKLTAWWTLDFPVLRAEVKKVFKRDIPLTERDQWEAWHADARADHTRLTAEIIRLETDLNARIYALFDLTADEICIIEESTKYRYVEV